MRHTKFQAPKSKESSLHITLLSQLSAQRLPFRVPASMPVASFIRMALDTLAQGEDGERIQTMQRYYEPVLELCDADGQGHEVACGASLAEAGFVNGSECRLAARPIKGEQMFCRHCG